MIGQSGALPSRTTSANAERLRVKKLQGPGIRRALFFARTGCGLPPILEASTISPTKSGAKMNHSTHLLMLVCALATGCSSPDAPTEQQAPLHFEVAGRLENPKII